jgi:hypothetical protein
MPTLHRIRLLGPWELRTPTMEGRLTIPTTLHNGGYPTAHGQVSLYRRFGQPTNRNADESIWLVFTGVVGTMSVTLNDMPLGTLAAPGEFAITTLMRERNQLTVTFPAATPECGLTDEVRLEIRTVTEE